MYYTSSVFSDCKNGDGSCVELFLNGDTSSDTMHMVIALLDKTLSAKEHLIDITNENRMCTNCGEGIMISSGEFCNVCYC